MLFLLSSDYSPRYKQDILRCLAAPMGSVVQFRYDKAHVPAAVLNKLTSQDTKFPLDGIVCSVASKGRGLLPMVPVRKVSVQKPRVHGETISLALTVKEVAVANPADFTAQLDILSMGQSPRVVTEDKGPEGAYLFESETPKGTEVGSSVLLWERAVSTLREQHAYKDEPFFWVVLGIENSNQSMDTSRLHSWPEKLSPREQYRLLIYHFQPRGGTRPNSKMEVTFGTLLQTVAPPDTKIDSRYDLKGWWFSTSDNARSQPTWLRIRSADTWDLDLTITVTASHWRPLLSGTLIGVPAILALIPQTLPLHTKIGLGVGSVALGIISSWVSARSDKK
jgi:hypothetical protein